MTIESMRLAKREKLLVRLADMIDAHSGNWNELCELQELVKELRSHPYNPQADQCEVSTCIDTIKRTRKDEREKVLLKYQNWLVKEAKIAFETETRAFMVRLNAKIVKEIEELRQEGKDRYA